ncbi:DUF2798 domain-containing protein [Lacrimispora sp. JR3]|uniref:DUF2798 domain-containing protein n=1 Tax=Lacrimispora sinapis TaxID=3111456 RepID=UPI00374A6093
MISKARFGTIINSFIGFILCLGLNSYILYHNGSLTFLTFIISYIPAFAISYTIGDLIPAKMWGDKIAERLGRKEGTVGHALVSTLVLDAIMVTCIGFLCTLINVGFTPVLIPAWLSTYPPSLLIGYVLLLVFMPLALKLAVTLTKEV